MTGPASLFRRKVREKPVSATFTRRHHAKLNAAAKRLNLTRADVLGLLVDLYADVLRIPADLVTDDDE